MTSPNPPAPLLQDRALPRQRAGAWSPRLVALLCLLCLPWIGQSQEDAPAQPPPAPAEELLEYADLLFSREQYPLAAQQYQLFIRESPKSPNLQIAWFRLGECYLKVQQAEDAATSFRHLVQTYKTGPFVGAAAYRLAVAEFNNKNHAEALKLFKTAFEQLTEPDAKLQSQFYYARSLLLTDQKKEALQEFDAVVAAKPAENNPFHERALLEAGRLAFDLGDTKGAMERFAQLAETATTKEFREEATVRGGLMAAEAGDDELSEKLLSTALKFSDTSPWKSLAQVGSIFNAFAREDYDRVIGLYNSGAFTPPDDSRAKLLLVVGHSFRMKGDPDAAVQIYSIVEARYPNIPEGIEAGYRKLQILYQTGDELLPEVAQRFTEKQSKIDANSPFVDMAHLMKAEWHFSKAENAASGSESEYAKNHYHMAAAAYSKVRPEKVEEKYHEIRLYKQGWSEIESGNPRDGIRSLTSFIQNHSQSALVSSALAKRAMAYQAEKDHQSALGDYQDIAKNHPEAKELEFALQQTALILAHQNKTEEMIAAYEELLKKFPETEGLGEAHYWIGVGNFNLEKYEEAIPHLTKAREIDPDHNEKASLRVVVSHYHLDQMDELAEEARRYLNLPAKAEGSGEAKSPIPPQVLEYLGRKLAATNDFENAEYFLSQICDVKAPHNTSIVVWKLLAECRVQLKRYQESLVAYDSVIMLSERPSERASAYLDKGSAQFQLKEFEAARSSVQESLRSQKEGRTNALARILLGDIAAGTGDLEEAVREYLVVSQIFSDPEVTPEALNKAIQAYRSLGQQEKADELAKELRSKFPSYQG